MTRYLGFGGTMVVLFLGIAGRARAENETRPYLALTVSPYAALVSYSSGAPKDSSLVLGSYVSLDSKYLLLELQAEKINFSLPTGVSAQSDFTAYLTWKLGAGWRVRAGGSWVVASDPGTYSGQTYGASIETYRGGLGLGLDGYFSSYPSLGNVGTSAVEVGPHVGVGLGNFIFSLREDLIFSLSGKALPLASTQAEISFAAKPITLSVNGYLGDRVLYVANHGFVVFNENADHTAGLGGTLLIQILSCVALGIGWEWERILNPANGQAFTASTWSAALHFSL